MNFIFEQPSRLEIVPSQNDNIDILIKLEDGRVYRATFFTVENIKTLMSKWRQSGEYANWFYVACDDMIVVDAISRELIQAVIEDLIESNSLDKVCVLMSSDE